MITARRWVVRGRVQGVGYRYFVRLQAERLSLTGWIENKPDGAVETFAQGVMEDIDRLEAALWKGPRQADVRKVESFDAPPESGSVDFEIR